MSFSFIFPRVLWALLLIPAFWIFAWLVREPNLVRLGRIRYPALILLRTLILAGLILALAGTQLARAVDDTAVVFLIDGSDSVAPAARQRALEYVNEAMAAGEGGDQAAVVLFGADAAVERAPQAPAPVRRLSSIVRTSRTDIADAVQLGLALLPAEAQKRLVLLSDGGENEGRAVEAARLAALRGVPIEVLVLPDERGADVLLAGLSVPPDARESQELPLTVRVESSVSGPARIEVFADSRLVATEDVDLAVGRSDFLVTVPAGETGFRRFEARIEAPADTQPLNNRAAAFTQVAGPPRVLLIASAAERAAPLQGALDAAGVRSELLSPERTPSDPAQLLQYAAVIIVDTPAADVSNAAQRALVTYVRDQGGGLAMIGGSEAFGAGGWRRSPLAEALPVELDPPARSERPDLALALVIDRSGSMSEAVVGNRTKLDLAKEAVYQSTLGLARSDQIGVIAFDDTAQTVLPMQTLPELSVIEGTLSSFNDGGGTDIRSGIAAAAEMLEATDARIKHAILLTDGLAESNYADLIDQMRASQVTITIVSIGSDANPNLQAIAGRGGGRFYRVLAPLDVPRIFLAETVQAARRDIVEGAFTPALALPAPPVRDLGGLPPLYGYNATEPREAARTLLIGPDDAPILAIWQYGLGRSLAWTSDLKGQWARDWVGWEQFPRFAAGLIDVLAQPPSSDRLSLELRTDGPQAIIDMLVSGVDGRPDEAATIEGRLLSPTGETQSLRFTQVGIGRYRAVAATDQPGVYLVQAAALDGAAQPIGTASGGLVVSYSPEYGSRSAAPALLNDLAAISGGHIALPAADLFASLGQRVGRVSEIGLPLLWMALALLPLDIALRRLFLRPAELTPLFARRPRREAATPEGDRERIERLQAARARARRPAPASDSVAPPVTPPAESPSPVASTPPEAPPTDDDPLGTLLAAKRRRRR